MKILKRQQGKRCSEKEYLSYTHKRCGSCNAIKAVSAFYRKKTKTKRGWSWDSMCIECRRIQCVQYGQNNREKRNARLRAWRKNNPKKARANDRRARLKHKYGISESELNAMKLSQNNRCAICGERSDRLFIDHDHITGKIRSLLCPTCNTFLGWYERRAGQIIVFQQYLNERAAAHE